MIKFVIGIVLFPLILCQDKEFVKDENVHGVNSRNCENSSGWTQVVYKSIEIAQPYSSPSGLRASEKSCTRMATFLDPETVLHFKVYVKTKDVTSGIVILVKLEENGIIARVVYNRASDNYAEGWKEIALQVNSSGLGYIDLLGYSGDNEMVLFDSVYYTNNNTTVDTNADKEYVKIDNESDEEGNKHITEDISNKNDINDIPNETNEVLRYENTQFRNDERFEFGTWAIVLISLGCVTVTALVAVCAYYLGKYRSPRKIIPVVYDVEPPKVDMLPRVRGTVEPFNYNYDS